MRYHWKFLNQFHHGKVESFITREQNFKYDAPGGVLRVVFMYICIKNLNLDQKAKLASEPIVTKDEEDYNIDREASRIFEVVCRHSSAARIDSG
jgi:hypothetical protein